MSNEFYIGLIKAAALIGLFIAMMIQQYFKDR